MSESDAPTADPKNEGTPLSRLLVRIAEHAGAETIDRVWIFPARRVGRVESAVVVAAVREDGGDRHRVLTGRYLARRDDKGRVSVEDAVDEHGAAPADRVGRLVEGVLRRVDDELAAAQPELVRLDGDPEAWSALLDRVGTPPPPELP